MSVYIPNLNLPNKDYGKMVVTIYPDGSVVEYLGDIGRNFGTAIPVSPHGRVIDADVIMTKLKETSKLVFGNNTIPENSALSVVAYYIDTAPTIIPASKEV